MKQRPPGSPDNISSTVLAEALGINDVQVRKDLAIASNRGKPKIGYITTSLIEDIERFLGHDNITDAILVGAGHLGKALLAYKKFEDYGLKIIAAFDQSKELIDTTFNSVDILDVAKLTNIVHRLKVHIGILTVPDENAQECTDLMVAGGIRVIWNFTSANLNVNERIVVKNEDMAASLALLTKQLKKNIEIYGLN
jgi:redox-sensing transcriptional repressor